MYSGLEVKAMFYVDFEVLAAVIGGISATFVVIEKVCVYSRKLYERHKRKLLSPNTSINNRLAFEKNT